MLLPKDVVSRSVCRRLSTAATLCRNRGPRNDPFGWLTPLISSDREDHAPKEASSLSHLLHLGRTPTSTRIDVIKSRDGHTSTLRRKIVSGAEDGIQRDMGRRKKPPTRLIPISDDASDLSAQALKATTASHSTGSAETAEIASTSSADHEREASSSEPQDVIHLGGPEPMEQISHVTSVTSGLDDKPAVHQQELFFDDPSGGSRSDNWQTEEARHAAETMATSTEAEAKNVSDTPAASDFLKGFIELEGSAASPQSRDSAQGVGQRQTGASSSPARETLRHVSADTTMPTAEKLGIALANEFGLSNETGKQLQILIDQSNSSIELLQGQKSFNQQIEKRLEELQWMQQTQAAASEHLGNLSREVSTFGSRLELMQEQVDAAGSHKAEVTSEHFNELLGDFRKLNSRVDAVQDQAEHFGKQAPTASLGPVLRRFVFAMLVVMAAFLVLEASLLVTVFRKQEHLRVNQERILRWRELSDRREQIRRQFSDF